MNEYRKKNPDYWKTYYIINIDGIDYAISGKKIRERKCKLSEISNNCVMVN